MGERGGGGDSDSDETVVEGSVIESDLEGEELRSRRLSFLNKDVSPKVRIAKGGKSPEIGFMHKFRDDPYTSKEENQINTIHQEMNESDQSQSLLQGWISCLSVSENIPDPVYSLNAAAGRQQNNSVDLNAKVVGFLKDSEEKISEKLSDEDLSPETSLRLDAFLEELVMFPKEQILQEIFAQVLEDCQKTNMTAIDTDNTVKEHNHSNDTDLSLTSLGKIFLDVFSEQSAVSGEVEISDLFKPLSDSESPKMLNCSSDMLECQGYALPFDTLADEKSDALPAELVTALNCFSGPVATGVPSHRQLSAEEEQLNSEPSVPQLHDDYTQLTSMFEPQLPTVQVEEIKAMVGSNWQRTMNEQLVGDQQREKEVISDYWCGNFYEKPTGEGIAHSVETNLCAETTKAKSRRAKQLKRTSSRKCTGHDSSCHQILHRTSHSGNTTGNRAKDFEKIQKSTSNDKHGVENNICQGMIILNGNKNAERTRRSKRIQKKMTQEASLGSLVNPILPIPVCRINRKNIFGETLLHKAVADEDVNLVCNIIKSGANVNVKDSGGRTALHKASVEGLYRIADELLKAGADVNARGSEKVTPLQDAVREGHYELSQLLLWYGADPLLKNKMGRCALEEASDQSMRKLLKTYIAKSGRCLEEIPGEDARRTLSAPSSDNTSLHQAELNADDTVQHDHTKASKEGFAKSEQSIKKKNLVTCIKNKVLQDLEDHGLNEENLKDTNSDLKETEKSVIGMAEAATKSKITEKSNKHETYVSSVHPTINQGTAEKQKAVFPDVGPNEMGFSVDTSDHNSCSTVDVEGKLCLPNQTEMQQECGFNSGNNGETNSSSEEWKRDGESTASFLIAGKTTTDLHFPTASVSAERMSLKQSESANVTEVYSQSVRSTTLPHGMSPSQLQQEIKSHESDQHSLKQTTKDSLNDSNLNSDMRTNSKQIIYLKNLTSQVKSDVDGNKINGESLSSKISMPLLQESSLQADESESVCANLSDSDSTDISQQTIANGIQNISTSISKEGTCCTEQTFQIAPETLLAHELLAATSGEGVSETPVNCSGGMLSSSEQKDQQPEEGKRVLLHGEESAVAFLSETPGNAISSEMRSTALQLQEKEALQRKRENLQKTDQKADFHFGINADKSPYSTQNTKQETSQKTDKGVFAEITGTEDTEKNKEDRNAESDVLSQFTETEAIQTKRVKLDPQETSQKTDLCSSGSKSKVSLNQSQFKRRSKQQTSKQPESAKKEALVSHVAYWTRSRTKRNAKGENQLHIAAIRGDLSLVKTLISSGICINEKDNAGWTAIHEASVRGFTEVMLELLKAGADVNCRSLDGILPIHGAVSGNYLEAVRILLQHGANPHERDDSGKNALDKARDDEMRELLESYSAIDSGHSVETIGVAKRKYNHPTMSRRSKLNCNDYSKNGEAALVPQCEKCSVHDESDVAIQDTEQKQKELLLLELRTSKDADAYIQKLSQIQDTLNEMLSKQKKERDTLAKKYRASVESFKKGALREQLVKLASRQKSLLIVAQNQKELVQKIQNYKKEKQVFAVHSKKQISDTVICCGNSKGQDLTADKMSCPNVVTFSTRPGASMPNGNRVEAHLSLENRFSVQECSQHPNSCLAERGVNKEAIRNEWISDHSYASESGVKGCPFSVTAKVTNVVEVVTLPSETPVSATETKRLQQRDIDCVVIAEQGNKSLNPTSVTNTLNILDAQSTVVSNNIYQPSSDCARVPPAEDPLRDGNKDSSQQQQVFASTSTENFPNALQEVICRSSVDSFNANSVLTSLVSNTDYSINLSQKSSQSSSSQQCEQKQLKCRGNNKKKLQLIDLLQQGKIKPGENVLEFKLQEFSHKATLMENGKIKINNRIFQNPVQWVKELLGNDISVTWKYVWNKVTYLGTQLSKFLVEKVSASNDLELLSQQREPVGSYVLYKDARNSARRIYKAPIFQELCTPMTEAQAHANNTFMLSKILYSLLFDRQLIMNVWLGVELKTIKTQKRKRKALKSYMSCSPVRFNSLENVMHFLLFNEIVIVHKDEFLPCHIMEKYWNFYKDCEDFGF